jgi:hypothetical protein
VCAVLSHIFGDAHADGESDKLIASVTKQAASQHHEWSQPKAQDIPAADLRKMLSQRQRLDKPSVMINGVEYVIKLNDVMYQVSNHKQTMLPLALIDRGANSGVAGSDTRLIDKSLHSVHIQGINNHMIKDVPIGTVSAVVNTQRGEVIAIMHQYAYTGKGGTIHSSGQLEWCGNDVNDCSIKIDGGRQQLTTPNGYVNPIDIRRGLPYIMMRPFTDEEFEELPHVFWTSEDDWDPTSLDSVISDDPNWYEAEPSPPLPDPMYDEYGEFRGRVLINQHEWQVHYFNANLYHDMVTGRSITAILHFLNQTPMDWYLKKQATVETATFGSEFIAARTTIDQILDLRTTLRYLGIPIREKSYVFGDNKTIINASSTPHAKLHKRHNALSFHRV